MSSWMNDTAVQNHNGAGFNHLDSNPAGAMLDPSAFMNNPPTFDPAAQFQNQQLQQRMQNGGMRNGSGSPVFNSPAYQTNQVIPSKRPRPREGSLGTSPRPAPGMLPLSRSQTPQGGPYSGGFPASNGSQQHPSQGPPYSHLQNGSTNASPSPIMANQLRPGGVPQRVSTASPHPFSPAGQQYSQASPPQSDHGSRVDTPQGSNPYAQTQGFAQGFQNFTPPPGRSSAPPPNSMTAPQMQQQMQQQLQHQQQQQQQQQPTLGNPQMYAQQAAQQAQQAQAAQAQQRPQSIEQQKMLYQMHMQQNKMQQQGLMAAQRGNMPPMQAQNGQVPGMRPQQPQQAPSMNPESFMKSLATFMQQRNLPLEMNPVVFDRPIPLVSLYLNVRRFRGYKKVTSQNGWAQVAQSLQFHPMQSQAAGQQLKGHYERYLLMFEEAWQMSQQQRQKMAMMQQTPNPGIPVPQMSPTKQMNPQAAMQQSQQYMQQQHLMQQQQQHQLQQQHMQTTPVKQMHHSQQPSLNGFSTPQQPRPMGPQSHVRNSLSRTLDATPPQNGTSLTMPSPVSSIKQGSLSLQSPQVDMDARINELPAAQDFKLPDQLVPRSRILDSYGGVDPVAMFRIGDALKEVKVSIPQVHELGTIDVHTLTMGIQSGIHAEVRLALDTLVSLSIEHRITLDLRACEDLVETLIDCAETQVDLLAENAAEVSDVMDISSYDDVFRNCRFEQDQVQDIRTFGTLEYELDRAVDRLICITTIMRNFSFIDTNYMVLADEFVIKFLCIVIRYLGTRNMLLRTNQNTLDFMKDVIIFLSNVSHEIKLPGREQALCLLHFLLAFSPCPPNSSEKVTFSRYDPAIHRYLPPAVESLAKLLARDEPNRTHYKTIFTSDVASSPPYDLLTRTFALAISGIPEDRQDGKRGSLLPVVEARKPFLMQSIMAADILSNLAPAHEAGVAKSWLTSEDGFAQNLSRLILSLCIEVSPQQSHGRQSALSKGADDQDLLHLTMGGISILRRLGEKTRDPDDPDSTIPVAGLPSKDNLLAALKIVQPRLQGVLNQLCAYAGLGT